MRSWIVCLLALGAIIAAPLGCESPKVTESPPVDSGVADSTTQVDTNKPDTNAADTGAPDNGTPDPGQPDKGTPDPGQPDKGQPDPGQPDDAPADTGKPEPATPDTSQPEVNTESAADTPAPQCKPPAGKIAGTRIGNYLRNETLLDCNGNAVKFDQFCNGKPMWISLHHEW